MEIVHKIIGIKLLNIAETSTIAEWLVLARSLLFCLHLSELEMQCWRLLWVTFCFKYDFAFITIPFFYSIFERLPFFFSSFFLTSCHSRAEDPGRHRTGSSSAELTALKMLSVSVLLLESPQKEADFVTCVLLCQTSFPFPSSFIFYPPWLIYLTGKTLTLLKLRAVQSSWSSCGDQRFVLGTGTKPALWRPKPLRAWETCLYLSSQE